MNYEKACIDLGLDIDVSKLSDSEIDKVNNYIDENDYKTQRKKEYDKLNQFEMFYNDKINGTTTWVDSINAIKVKYPKPMK